MIKQIATLTVVFLVVFFIGYYTASYVVNRLVGGQTYGEDRTFVNDK